MTFVHLADGHVGWDAGAGVVASVRLEREGDDLVIASLEYEDITAARELVDAVVRAATTLSIVGDDAILGEVGFEPAAGRWTREVVVEAAAEEHTHAITLADLEAAIRASWSAETSDVPERWTSENPAYQQCDVTARVLRDYLGGEVLVAGVALDGRRVDRHAWNRLPSGLTVDLTREQFQNGERLEPPEVLENFITAGHEERYELLATRVRTKLGA